ASVKAAIAHPNVKILNCSLNTSHRYIRNYYARMHEAKFLMGAIAGAMTENDRLGYLADYPILGSIANINAFALGAKMINPRAKVYLEWTSKKGLNAMENLKKNQVSIISGKDMVIPEEASRFFGLYSVEYEQKEKDDSAEENRNLPDDSAKDAEMKVRNLAMPVWHWGKFYERLIRTIMDGTWKYDDNTAAKKAINYWWGMSAGVIDVICSQNLPIGTKRLVDLLKSTILSGEFNPFSGVLYSQKGIIQDDPDRRMTPEEIVTMDWLAENVIGDIPKMEELQEEAKPVTAQQGVEENKPVV
ncbi:MAG: BMP family ABC transporter substrate-binding protein, partial [Blautia obeum]|nr:BMP family ABC transporter substrate-binding protein [Blautia obeum]